MDGRRSGGAGCVEVSEELFAPLLEGSAEAGELETRAGRQAAQDLLGDLPADSRVALVADLSKLPGALPGHEHLKVAIVGLDSDAERACWRSVSRSPAQRNRFRIR